MSSNIVILKKYSYFSSSIVPETEFILIVQLNHPPTTSIEGIKTIMRTTIAFLVFFSFIIAGCGKSQEQIEMEKQITQLKEEIASKDKFVEEVTSTINDIHNKLESTWAMQKNIVQKTPTVENGKMLSQADIKTQIMDRISNISSIITENRKKIANLQRILAEQKTQYTGLSLLVDDLKKSLEEREKTIDSMRTQVQNLEGDIASKIKTITVRDETIENQTKQMNKVYYVAGKKSELEEKKIVSSEGGILWGLLGTTTVLTNTYNDGEFTSLDKTKDMLIEVIGTIKEIVPVRDTASYTKEEKPDKRTLLTITKPEIFWRDSHLVIVTE